LIRNFCQVRLRIWNQQIFSLCAIDRIAETPSADCFDAFAVAALCPLAGQTGATLTARRNCADQNAIANFIASQTFAQFFDYADWLMSNHKSGSYGVLASKNVEIRAANRR
jgi:hypothetical protein